jgi:hypothetical protein
LGQLYQNHDLPKSQKNKDLPKPTKDISFKVDFPEHLRIEYLSGNDDFYDSEYK